MKRLFISFNLPQETKQELAAYLMGLRKTVPPVKWAHPEILHITLHFLGSITSRQQEGVEAAMNQMAGQFGELNFKIKGLLFLPHPKNIRVITLHCYEVGGNKSLQLRENLKKEIINLGIEADPRPWRPHITIGRVKKQGPFLKKIVPSPNLEFIIDSFELMNSKLSAHGAQHIMVKSYRL